MFRLTSRKFSDEDDRVHGDRVVRGPASPGYGVEVMQRRMCHHVARGPGMSRQENKRAERSRIFLRLAFFNHQDYPALASR
jgi:hypothetical protein